MADVYEGASITIAATSSGSSNQGFPSTYQGISAISPVGNTGLFVSESKSFPDPVMDMGFGAIGLLKYHDQMRLWPLLTRAWVYQERKLSACVVHIGKNQLYWECRESFRSEDGADDILNPDEAVQLLKHVVDDPHEAWRKDVEHYSLLQLTFEKDRLPAISAVVERMQSTRPDDTYIAGLWLNTLLHDLAWRARTAVLPRPESYHPTWSWISLKTAVVFSRCEPLSSIRLLKVEYEIIGPKHIGRTLHARIDMVGKVISVEWSKDCEWGKYVAMQPDESVVAMIFDDQLGYPDFEYSTARPPIEDKETLDCLLLFREWASGETSCHYGALVLRRTDLGCFERVGMVQFSNYSYRDKSSEENSRRHKAAEEFIDSLPERQFAIV